MFKPVLCSARFVGYVLNLLAFLVPVIAIPAPRAVAALLGLTFLLVVPFLWQQRQRIALKTTYFLAIIGTLCLFYGWLLSPLSSRALNLGVGGLVVFLAGWCVCQVALLLPSSETKHTYKCLLFGELIAVVLVLAEYMLNQPITTFLAHLQDKPVPPLYVVDRGIIIISLLFWPAVASLRLSWSKVFLLVVPITYFISCTSSQAATAALPFGLVTFLLAKFWPSGSSRFLKICTIALFFFGPFLVWFIDEITKQYGLSWTAANSDARLGIWKAVSSGILEHPLIGWGIGAARIFSDVGASNHPHNGVLQIWLEFGLPGVVLAVVALVAILRKTKGQPAMQAAYTSWLLVFCVGYEIWQLWWIATAALLSVFLILTRQPARS